MKNCFIHSSVVFRKDVAILAGGFNEEKNARHIEDYDLWLKMGQIGKFGNIKFHDTSFMVRLGGLSSKNKIQQLVGDIKLIKKYQGKYPKYFQAIILRYLILMFYKIFNFVLPKNFKNKLIKIYKKA